MKPIATAELIGAYIAGASTLQLAERYPICRTAIHYRLKRAGVTLRRCGPPIGNQNAKGRALAAEPPPPSPGGNPIPGDEEYED